MSEEGQEDILDDFLRIMDRNSKRECITEKRVAKLIKELHNLALDLRGLCRKRHVSGVWERQRVDRIFGRHMHGSLKCIFHFPRFCSRFSETPLFSSPQTLRSSSQDTTCSQPKRLKRGRAQWSANSSHFVTFCFYVLSLEDAQVLSSSISSDCNQRQRG